MVKNHGEEGSWWSQNSAPKDNDIHTIMSCQSLVGDLGTYVCVLIFLIIFCFQVSSNIFCCFQIPLGKQLVAEARGRSRHCTNVDVRPSAVFFAARGVVPTAPDDGWHHKASEFCMRVCRNDGTRKKAEKHGASFAHVVVHSSWCIRCCIELLAECSWCIRCWKPMNSNQTISKRVTSLWMTAKTHAYGVQTAPAPWESPSEGQKRDPITRY